MLQNAYFLQKSVPIQPKTSNILPKFAKDSPARGWRHREAAAFSVSSSCGNRRSISGMRTTSFSDRPFPGDRDRVEVARECCLSNPNFEACLEYQSVEQAMEFWIRDNRTCSVVSTRRTKNELLSVKLRRILIIVGVETFIAVQCS